MAIILFGVRVVSIMLDPLTLIGFIVAGLVSRKYWIVLAVAGFWAIAMDLLTLWLATRQQLDYQMQYLPERFVAAAIVSSIVYGIAHLIRTRPSK